VEGKILVLQDMQGNISDSHGPKAGYGGERLMSELRECPQCGYLTKDLPGHLRDRCVENDG